MKTFGFLVLAWIACTSCGSWTTRSTLTLSFDFSKPITSADSLIEETDFEPPETPLQVLHGRVSGSGTHSDHLKGSLLAIPGQSPSDQVLFHFLSPGHSGTQTVTVESVHVSGNTLSIDYRVVSPETNTADFQQFASSVVVRFR